MKTRTLSVKQARLLDTGAQTEYLIPSLILMENAGRSLALIIQNFLIPPINRCKVAMICGVGNNGGDGFVAARHLFQQGIPSHVFLVGDPSHMKEDAKTNFRIIEKLGISIEPIESFEHTRVEWTNVPVVIVDAVLGIGFEKPLRESVQNTIRRINTFKKMHNVSVKILAVDIPSGLHGDEGVVGPDIVRADMTVTFACVKQGMMTPDARSFVGRIEVVDIGVPEKLLLSI